MAQTRSLTPMERVEAPAAQETRGPEGPAVRRDRGVGPWLSLGAFGVVLILGGLASDAVAHATDPELVNHEELLSLSNPAHAALVAGIVAVALGVTGATWRALGPRRRARRRFLAVMTAVGAAAAGTLGWAARAEHLEPAHDAAGSALAALAGHNDGRASAAGDVGRAAAGPCNPTPEERARAQRLVDDARAGSARFASIQVAATEGYVGPLAPASTDHYANLAYLADGKVLDTQHPEILMYTLSTHGPVLTGVMFLTGAWGEPGPQVGGCLTRWHVHEDLCLSLATLQLVGSTTPTGRCPPGGFLVVPPPALHIWFFDDVPGGPFAPDVDGAWLAAKVG